MTVLCAVMQLNAHVVWSESRMLRKLRFLKRLKGATLLRASASEGTMGEPRENDEVFALLYAQLSKGQHRLSGRLYQEALPLLFGLIDLLLSSGNNLTDQIMRSDALVALRLLVCAGSVVVLGARPLSILESLLLFVCFSVYLAAMACISGRHEDSLFMNAGGLARLALLAAFAPFTVLNVWQAARSTQRKLSNVANRILDGTLSDSPALLAYFNDMKQVAKRHRATDDSTKMRGMSGAGYWSLGWRASVRGVFSFAISISSVFLSSSIDKPILPVFVLLEAFELFSLFLFILNETQVEPVLLIELLNISEADK